MARLRSNVPFLRLFFGRIVTNAGDSMYFIAAMWLVWELTGSSLYTGIAGFLIRAPSALQFLFGPLVDRWSLRWLLVSTQFVQGVSVLLVPVAAATGHLSVWVVLVLMPVLMLLNQFVYPAQSAALPRIVDEDNLVRANSLFSTAYSSVNMVFNAASGVLIAVVGAVTLYLIDAATFGLAILLFFGLSVPNANGNDDESDEAYFDKLREGFSYIKGSLLVPLMFIDMSVNFTYGVMMAVLPAFADAISGPATYGLLLSAEAAGGLLGAAGVSFIDDYPVGKVTIVGYLLAAIAWTGALVVPGLVPTTALFLITFIPVGAVGVLDASVLQAAVADQYLGRVFSVSSSASTLILPVGMLVGGVATSVFDIVTVMAVNAVALALVGFYYLALPQLRSLPPVSDVDGSSLELQAPVEPTGGDIETGTSVGDTG